MTQQRQLATGIAGFRTDLTSVNSCTGQKVVLPSPFCHTTTILTPLSMSHHAWSKFSINKNVYQIRALNNAIIKTPIAACRTKKKSWWKCRFYDPMCWRSMAQEKSARLMERTRKLLTFKWNYFVAHLIKRTWKVLKSCNLNRQKSKEIRLSGNEQRQARPENVVFLSSGSTSAIALAQTKARSDKKPKPFWHSTLRLRTLKWILSHGGCLTKDNVPPHDCIS